MTTTERTTDPTAALRWEPPGPGFWLLDDSHVTQVTTRYFMEALTEIGSDPQTWKGFRDYGLLLAGFAMGAANGYLYVRLRIAGAPDKPGGPPPAFLLKLLLALHPELRYRKKQATETLATKRWRQDRARWQQELAPALREQLLIVQQVDPACLDDAALRGHLRTTRKALVEGYRLHFNLLPADRLPVGDWLRRTCEWTGITPAEALQVLRSRTQASLAPLTLLDHLAEAVRRSEAALAVLQDTHPNASDQMIRLREASPEVAAALDSYLSDYGNRVVTGYDLCDLTLRELQHVLLGSILAQVEGQEQAIGVRGADAEERAAQLRDRVPVARRAEYDALLEEACLAYGLGDENEGLTICWPLGLLRRAMLVAGRRLADRGLVVQPEHVLDTTQAELDALLGGPGTAPQSTELTRRAEERRQLNQVTPPARLGKPEPPPPEGVLPLDLERVNAAVQFYVMNYFPEPAKDTRASGPRLAGLGVSQGVYTGRARVVHSPADFDRVEAGDILVASTTSSGYNVLLPLLGAIVTDRGGAVCHAAIVAREFGIAAVVGTGEATTRIPDGARISVDGTNGTVAILAGANS
jgi:phosphohistidine swiveling domain-containing protein